MHICSQCDSHSATEEDFEECVACGEDFCITCLNGQYSCEACLEEEKEDNEHE